MKVSPLLGLLGCLGLASFAAAAAGALSGCSSSSTPANESPQDAAVVLPTEADAATDAAPTCAPPPHKSLCESDGAWVRGVAHFDPSRLKPGGNPVLRLALRHSFALVKGEETIGGRLHGFVSVPIAEPKSGEVTFAIDMCDLGTSMWSEENGAFHLVLIIDENDDNDLDKALTNEEAITIATPTDGELVKMVDLDISCNAPSACLDVKIDCTGAACTTIQPVKSCSKKMPGCKSDSAFCK